MSDTVLPKPEPDAFDNLMRTQARSARSKDEPPRNRAAWEQRRAQLRTALFQAMGQFPDRECPLEPKTVGELRRPGYRIEKVTFQSRPDVWVTATAYVPDPVKGKYPAVLVVHGHWAMARRDPVVQARCLGLVKLGFVVLAVDAFGAGERYTEPARGTYHGALYGSTLWPAGLSLLGVQVHDNHRAVDYLLTRPEVDGSQLGITGASGGGNQSMYAGALDERLGAVAPVCSVGTYQAYLHAACCVCEVLPAALRFTEEGAVLGLTAPRALLVINATKDAFQFSVGEAKKSVAQAEAIYKVYAADEKLRHTTFESPHAYNQPMREAMYGWMTQWLKNEGKGEPIPEPKHEIEKPEDLSCFPDGKRPANFLFPPSLAARAAGAVLAKSARKPTHREEWEAAAVVKRAQLRTDVFGDFPKPPKPAARLSQAETVAGVTTTGLVLHPEPNLPLPVVVRSKGNRKEMPACVLLHLDGKAEAFKHPLAGALVEQGWHVTAPDLRATGETKPARDGIRDAPDHNTAEHALWVGRPLLGQWVFDVQCLVNWLAMQPNLDLRRLTVVGLGQAGIVALCAVALEERLMTAAAVDMPISYVPEFAYAPGTRMGLLAPGILRVGDIPQLAALAAPRRLVIAGGVSPEGRKRTEKQLREAYTFTREVYGLHKAEAALRINDGSRMEDVVTAL
jgi:cephalosporin-C deacetylase-like acetyl esterase